MPTLLQEGVKTYINIDYILFRPWAIPAMKRDNFKCKKCDKWSNNLLVHHIDNSRKTGKLNNNLDNLITLCKSCHAIIHGQPSLFNRSDFSLILELRNKGLTFQEIGNRLEISRQRVHQIYKKKGGKIGSHFNRSLKWKLNYPLTKE